MRQYLNIFLASVLSLIAVSCGKSGSTASPEGENMALTYADNLTIDYVDGYYRATVRNPWDTTKTLHTYILIPDSTDIPTPLPKGTVVRIPLRNALVYSTVHQSLIYDLGAPESIGGICDAEYIHNPDLLARIKQGDVADCGNSYTPNLEKIIGLSPDAILLSPYENSGNYGKLGQLGIPVIECADYMESSPLGRTEWMKLYGLLFGREERSSDMFAEIENEYLALKSKAATTDTRPSVIIDRLYGNTWYVPRGSSTMCTYITDAGGTNPFAHISGQGSAGLSGEQVLHEGGDADFWLLRYSQATDKTLGELAADNVIYGMFTPFKSGKVYGCNTEKIAYYEETPFHPHWLLRDIMLVIHPELFEPDTRPRYFTPLAG